MSGISTHVLNTSLGIPAPGIPVILERKAPDDYASPWFHCASATTDADGRCRRLLDEADIVAGKYRLTFAVLQYFESTHLSTLYPEIIITFLIPTDRTNYHIPLLLSPFGYSTYRGT